MFINHLRYHYFNINLHWLKKEHALRSLASVISFNNSLSTSLFLKLHTDLLQLKCDTEKLYKYKHTKSI